ncbi:MAG: Cephalosporin hydroxylase [Mycobacterium sp.]|nr:Cephalosporin hydroxylase [Mycobacterium sp.]
MWNYQEILFAMRPSLVIEFGTRYGGSGLSVSRLGCRTPPRVPVPARVLPRRRTPRLAAPAWCYAHPRGLPTPVLGTFPAIIDVSELFSGIEIRPHILNAALHPRLIRLFGNERAAVAGGYPRLGSCR